MWFHLSLICVSDWGHAEEVPRNSRSHRQVLASVLSGWADTREVNLFASGFRTITLVSFKSHFACAKCCGILVTLPSFDSHLAWSLVPQSYLFQGGRFKVCDWLTSNHSTLTWTLASTAIFLDKANVLCFTRTELLFEESAEGLLSSMTSFVIDFP